MKKRSLFLSLVLCLFSLLMSQPFLLLKDSSSNLTHAQVPNYNVYFGDLHAHSTISNDAHPVGGATYEDFYPYGRDAMGLDFCTMTDHAEQTTLAEWELVKQEAAEHYDPGNFTTLIAFEWTRKDTGHKNVYFPDTNVSSAPWNSWRPNYDTPEELWQAASPYGALTNPHHPQSFPVATDWSYSNETHQRLVEIYSKWGNAEYDNAEPEPWRSSVSGSHSVQEALAMGQKVGFVGGTDTHSSLCGYLDPQEGEVFGEPDWLKYRGGLTGVWTTENTREGLWNALQNRRTFATTGEKISFWYTVDDSLMGSVIDVYGNPSITVEIIGTQVLQKIEIVRDNDVIYTKDNYQGETADSFVFTDTTLPEGDHYYYLRMKEDDANDDGYPEQAWASPVWVTKASGPTPTPTNTPTPSPIPTITPTSTSTPTQPPTTPTATSTPLPTDTPTLPSTSTPTPTATDTPLPTYTPTFAPTDTPTLTPTPSPTLTPSPEIFKIGHETGDLTEYDSTTTDGGDLSVTAAAALGGTDYGLSTLIDDTNVIYGEKTFTITSNIYRLRFYIDPNTLTMANNDNFPVNVTLDGTQRARTLVYLGYSTANGYRIRLTVGNDTGWSSTSWYAVTDAEHYVEVQVQYASSATASDGTATLWIDGVEQQQMTGIDLFDLAKPDRARLGALLGIDAGTSGTLYLDEFKFNG